MSNELIAILGYALAAVPVVILGLVAYRAVEIGRVSVSAVYRRRAFWTAALVVLLVLIEIDSLLPSTGPSSNPLGAVSYLLGGLSLVLFEVVFFAFIDGAVIVAMDRDFFHRDTLRWKRLRSAFYPIVIACALVSVLGGGYGLNFFPGVGTLFLLIAYGYSAAALVVSSGRTADMTLKRYVKMLGFSALGVVAAILDQIAYSWSGYNLPLGVVFIVISYLLYRAVMSLSPVGRVEKAVSANSIPHASGDGLQAHP